ncbi:MAG: tautomerase family protein [Candidatus Bathyarchaeia archaeon]
MFGSGFHRNEEESYTGTTKVFVELGVPAETVEVIIHEIPKNSWGVGGELASEKLRDVQPP